MRFSQQDHLNFIFRGIGSGLGQRYEGLSEAANLLRQQGLSWSQGLLIDKGDILPDANEAAPGWEFLRRARDSGAQLQLSKSPLINIGGDHSIALATVQSSLLHDNNLKLIWIDAHGDINTPASSLTGNFHGMPLAGLLNLFRTPLSGPFIRPENILMIGLRDLDPFEEKVIKDLNITVITGNEVANSEDLTISKIKAWLQKPQNNKQKSKVHISFDIDSLDPKYAPATGLHVSNGLTLSFANRLVREITLNSDVIAFDLVEINPLRAENGKQIDQTLNSAEEILSSFVTASLDRIKLKKSFNQYPIISRFSGVPTKMIKNFFERR